MGLLVKARANAILTEYGPNGVVAALSFALHVTGRDINFRLPVNVPGVAAALKRDRVRADEAHAARVAWRIVKDWCDSQMALVDAGQAEAAEVFLTYVSLATGRPLYESHKARSIPLLTGPGA